MEYAGPWRIGTNYVRGRRKPMTAKSQTGPDMLANEHGALLHKDCRAIPIVIPFEYKT